MDGRLALYSGAVFAGVLIAGTLITRPGFGEGGGETTVEATASPAAVATQPAANSARQADGAAVFAAPTVSRASHDNHDDHDDHDEEDDD